jgi:hypothetical protein
MKEDTTRRGSALYVVGPVAFMLVTLCGVPRDTNCQVRFTN